MVEMISSSGVPFIRLILIPSAITLAVTLLRLIGELITGPRPCSIPRQAVGARSWGLPGSY
jgi:hypothetical protein